MNRNTNCIEHVKLSFSFETISSPKPYLIVYHFHNLFAKSHIKFLLVLLLLSGLTV